MTRPGVAGRCGASDRGAASLFLLALGLVFIAAGVAGAAVGAARVGRHEARNAADFGALAGAAHAVEGDESACGWAARVVAADRARLVSCQVDGLEVVVRAEVAVTPLPGLVRHATAAARAGPVYESALRTTSSTLTAVSLSRGLLPFPHFGDWTQDGQPVSQPHEAMASRVAASQAGAVA
ncbi:MAG: hypothetical protein QOC94_1492 [Actinoplanes sp.]|nr:hypothetical protein [Actinoplanes sp.]